MKQIIILLVTLLVTTTSHAQLTAEQRIQDSVIGWYKILRFDHLKPQTTPSGKKKETDLNNIVDWMKKSYTPVGGLGTSARYINTTSYGVNFGVWNVSHDKLWTDEKGNFKPIAEEVTPFFIASNKLTGAWFIRFMSTPDAEYYAMQPDGYAAHNQFKEKRQGADPRIHPNAYKYLTWINEWHTVYLAPNNKLPIIPVTKGELLDAAEKGLANIENDNRTYAEEHWPNNKKAQDESFAAAQKEVDKYRGYIIRLREKYKSSLHEHAIVRDEQPTFRSFQLDPDLFTIDKFGSALNHAYPVYKIDGATKAKMKSDQPQWITIAYNFETKNEGNQLYEMYTALSQNLNYEYIYNYFFDPSTIKGKPYVAANEGPLKARLDDYRKRNNANINAASATISAPSMAGVFFKEDFASAAVGGDPANWYFTKYGKHHVVSTIDHQPGKWLRIGYNNETFPALLKGPFPENFSLEFDIISDPFTARTGGALNIYMSTYGRQPDGRENEGGNGKKLEITITSGNDDNLQAKSNYEGRIDTRINAYPEVNTENHSGGLVNQAPLAQFTNRQLKVHITIKLKDGQLNIFAGDKLVVNSNDFLLKYGGKCTNCSVLKGARMNILRFKNATTDWGNFSNDKDVGIYIGNIKITKE